MGMDSKQKTSSNWLSLTDYSNKYKVSISTLRRRIRVDDVTFKLDSGKYFIVDEPPGCAHRSTHQTAPDVRSAGREIFEDTDETVQNKDQQILNSANRLLDELKKAYTQILQEKDEQVRQLRDEVSDLRTLVRVLESENERLRKSEPLVFDDE